jgi:hypothetical protein
VSTLAKEKKIVSICDPTIPNICPAKTPTVGT